MCATETNDILQNHVRFANLMAQQINDASKPQNDSRYDRTMAEMARIAEETRAASSNLSANISRMNDELGTFVETLEGINIKTKKKESMPRKILRWLSFLVTAIQAIFAPPSTTLVSLVFNPDLNIRGCLLALTPLGQAAQVFCKMGSGAALEHVALPLQGRK